MDMYSYLVVLDSITITFFLLIVASRLSFFHPATVYLFFHVYAFSLRLIGLILGDTPLYGDSDVFRMVEWGEIARAMVVADAALLLFGLGVILSSPKEKVLSRPRMLSRSKTLGVVILFFLAGLPFFFLSRGSAPAPEGVAQFYRVFSMWPIAALCLAIHVWGFRWYLCVALALLLMIVSLQGYHRFMVILPLIFLMSSHLVRNRMRWPSFKLGAVCVVVIMMFPQLKFIGIAYQDGDTGAVIERLKQSFFLGERDIQTKANFLDQFAGALTLSDEYGQRYWGATYVGALTLFVPRVIWPGKPGLGDHTIAMATEDRPYDKEGRIITYLGEAYVNFGYVGVVIAPLFLAWALTRWFQSASAGPWNSVSMYVYLAVMVSFIQVYRDGLTSLVLFGVVQNLPMVFLCLAHVFTWGVRRSQFGRTI